MKHLVAQTTHISVVAQDFGDDALVVSFNEVGFAGEHLRFWGDNMFAKHRLSSIGFVSSRRSWFPAREMAEVLPKAQAFLRSRRCISYGFSQGGYGALKYANRLGASAVLAFSPQWSIDPADVGPFDGRFLRHFDPILGGGRRIESADICEAAFCVFDPREVPDRLNVAMIGRAQPVIAPFTGHGTINLVAESGIGGELLRYMLRTDKVDRAQLRRVLRGGRRRSQSYLRMLRGALLLRALRHRKSTRAISFLSRTNALCVDYQPLFHELLAHVRDERLAPQTLRDYALDRNNHLNGVDSLLAIMLICRRLRLPETEVRLAAKLIAVFPQKTRACLHALQTLIRNGLSSIVRDQLLIVVSQSSERDEFSRHFLRTRVSAAREDRL